MGITANVTNQQITASVGETQIDVSVSGGFGPTGPAGTTDYNQLINVPQSFPPSTHTHTSSQIADFTSAVVAAAPPTTNASLLVSGTLDAGRLPASVVLTTDSRLSDAREWSASTVSQADAEAGSSTSRVAFTPLRVFQAIAAWWGGSAAKAKLDGVAAGATANATDAQLRDRATHTGTQDASTVKAAGFGETWGYLQVNQLGDVYPETLIPATQLRADVAVRDDSWTERNDLPKNGEINLNDAIWFLDERKSLVGHQHNAEDVFVEVGAFNNAGQYSTSVAQSFENVATQFGALNASNLTSGTVPRDTLPSATTSVRGAIIVGTGLGVASGTVSVSYGSSAGTAAQGDDARLSDAREWSASTVTQAQAEAGTSTTRVAYTPQRVFQAVASWWLNSSAKSKLDGVATGATANQTDAYLLSRSNHTGQQAISTVSGLQTALDGKASLVGGLVPSSQLPSYVDDVVEYSALVFFPATGETGKIYVDRSNNKIYRWSGSAYVEISASPGSTDAVPEGSVNLYYTNARAIAASPVQSVAGKTGTVTLAKGDVGLGNVDNTSDASKPVSTAQAAADAAVASAAASDATTKANAAQAAAVQRANHTGTQTLATISDAGTAASRNVAATGDAGSTQVVLGSDTRLTDARVPTAHTHTGADVTLTPSDDDPFALTDPYAADFLLFVGYGSSSQDASLREINKANCRSLISAAAATHTHNASDISAGTLNAARLPNTAVTAGSYGSGTAVATFTVDGTGRLTAAGTASITPAGIGAASLSHAHSAADVTSGVFDIARIPVGTTAATVAAGNHGHSGADITSGTVPIARLGTGSPSASNFLRGDGTFAAAGSSSASDLTSGTLAYARIADPTVTSPSQITSSQNDYASFARGINRFTTNAAYNLTGMAAGNDGEVRVLTNVGTTAANTLTIKDQSASSTAANRFAVPWAGDCVIATGASVVVYYDGTTARWRVM